MVLELEGQEFNLGNFRADILCRNAADGSRVLIENQLERSDHKHFGQLMAYALLSPDIQTIIWIAKEFRAEHCDALDRLNETKNEKFRYFGIEVRVWQIGDSTPVPQFEIVSKPKDWNRPISRKAQKAASKDTSETRLQMERFWTEWNDCMIQKIGMQSFLNFDKDRYGSEFHMDAYLIQEKKEIGIRLYIGGKNDTEYFHLLKEQQEEIEREFAEPLEWDKRSPYAYNRILLRKTDTDPTDETDWPNQHEWLASKLELFDKVFGPRLKALNEKR